MTSPSPKLIQITLGQFSQYFSNSADAFWHVSLAPSAFTHRCALSATGGILTPRSIVRVNAGTTEPGVVQIAAYESGLFIADGTRPVGSEQFQPDLPGFLAGTQTLFDLARANHESRAHEKCANRKDERAGRQIRRRVGVSKPGGQQHKAAGHKQGTNTEHPDAGSLHFSPVNRHGIMRRIGLSKKITKGTTRAI